MADSNKLSQRQQLSILLAALEGIKDAPLSRAEMIEEARLALARYHEVEPAPTWVLKIEPV